MGYAGPPLPYPRPDPQLARVMAWQQQQAAYAQAAGWWPFGAAGNAAANVVPHVVGPAKPPPHRPVILQRWAAKLVEAGVPTRSHRWTYVEGERRRELVGVFRKRLVEREFIETLREEGQTEPYFPAGQGTLPCYGGSSQALVALTPTGSVLRFSRYTAFVDWNGDPDLTTNRAVSCRINEYLDGGHGKFQGVVDGVLAYCRSIGMGPDAYELLDLACAGERVTPSLACRFCGRDLAQSSYGCSCTAERAEAPILTSDRAGHVLKVRNSFVFAPERPPGHGVGRGLPRPIVTCYACRAPAGHCYCA